MTAVVMPEEAAAEKRRVVLMDIDGARDDRLHKSVVKLIRRDHSVISEKTYRRVARRRGLTKINAANVRKVCRDLGCDAVVTGVLRAEDGGYIFVIKMREASSGSINKRVAMRLKKPRLSKKIARGLRDRLLNALDDIEPVGDQEPAVASNDDFDDDDDDFRDDDDDFDRRPSRAERRRERRRLAKERRRERKERKARERRERKERQARERRERKERRARLRRERREREDIEAERDRADFDDVPPNKGFDDEDDDDFEDRQKFEDGEEGPRFDETPAEDDEVPEGLNDGTDRGDEVQADSSDDADITASLDDDIEDESKDPREYPVLVSAGLSVQKRDLSFNFDAVLTGTQVPTPYVGNPAPGVYANGELYPLAFVDGAHKAFRNIGFGFNVDRVLGLRVQTQQGAMPVTASAVQSRTEGNLRYRFNFGSKEIYPTLTASVGYGQLTFAIDDSQVALDVPNVEYQYVNPGLTLRVPLGERFALQAEARYLAVLNAGDIQLETQYGPAVTTGADADFFVEAKFLSHFLVRLGGHLTYIGYDFNSAMGKADRNGDGNQDVGGAADRFLGGYLTLGYQY